MPFTYTLCHPKNRQQHIDSKTSVPTHDPRSRDLRCWFTIKLMAPLDILTHPRNAFKPTPCLRPQPNFASFTVLPDFKWGIIVHKAKNLVFWPKLSSIEFFRLFFTIFTKLTWQKNDLSCSNCRFLTITIVFHLYRPKINVRLSYYRTSCNNPSRAINERTSGARADAPVIRVSIAAVITAHD